MVWKVELDRAAERDLDRLDPQTARRILTFLHGRIATLDDPRSIGRALKGSKLGEFWKYRVGDYRLISSIEDRFAHPRCADWEPKRSVPLNRIIFSRLSALLTLFLTLPVFADGTTVSEISDAAHRSGDMSRKALVSVFGNIVNNPLATGGAEGNDTILASIFQVTNGALLVIGGMFACYAWFRKLSQVAHSGAVYGQDKGTMWGPVRLVGARGFSANGEWLGSGTAPDAVGSVDHGDRHSQHGDRRSYSSVFRRERHGCSACDAEHGPARA